MLASTIQKKVSEQFIVYRDADWAFYQSVLNDDRDFSKKIVFDGETVEMMTKSHEHESMSRFVHLIVVEVALALDVPIHSGGSTTLQREDLEKGLEPDECFWIAHALDMTGKKRLDLGVDPPPDLVVEVDVTHAVVDRADVYAAMGIPELWQCRLGRFRASKLVDGKWVPTEYSLAFPALKVEDIGKFVSRLWDEGQTRILRDVRTWAETLKKS